MEYYKKTKINCSVKTQRTKLSNNNNLSESIVNTVNSDIKMYE